MNFLAHLYLSGEDKEIMVGNFIGDYVKGKSYKDFPSSIQKGIMLHRSIDFYTDTHPQVKESMNYFREGYGRYSAVIVDVIFDYFLSRNWSSYSTYSLRDFTRKAHANLLSNFFQLPSRVRVFLPILIQSKRLESYARIEGIKRALEIMSKYTTLPAETDYAISSLQENEDKLLIHFNEFMPDIINYVESEHSIKISKPYTKNISK